MEATELFDAADFGLQPVRVERFGPFVFGQHEHERRPAARRRSDGDGVRVVLRAAGTGGGWESMQQTIAFSDEIQREDIVLCEQVQRGLRSASYDRGRFSALRENGVHHFQQLLWRELREDV
jgi:hypothetical protein